VPAAFQRSLSGRDVNAYAAGLGASHGIGERANVFVDVAFLYSNAGGP